MTTEYGFWWQVSMFGTAPFMQMIICHSAMWAIYIPLSLRFEGGIDVTNMVFATIFGSLVAVIVFLLWPQMALLFDAIFLLVLVGVVVLTGTSWLYGKLRPPRGVE